MRQNKLLNSNLAKSILLNLAFFICALLFCEQKYEVSDDFVMETILSGAYSTQENPHMLFVNSLYGYLLLPLYKVFPYVSWYFIALLFFGFLSFVAIVTLIFEKFEPVTAFLFSIILLVFFSNDIYVLVQFTKTAALCLFSGALLILDALFQAKPKKSIMTGCILCLIGSMIRFQVIFETAPFIFIIFLFESLLYIRQFRKNSKKEWFRHYMKRFMGALSIIALTFCFQFINYFIYQSDNAYRNYYEYNQIRGSIVDSRDLGYETYCPELKELGISENDYQMLRRWNFSDFDYFTTEKMQLVAQIIKSKNSKYWGGWQLLFEQVQSRGYGTYEVCLACVILFLLALFYAPHHWWKYVGSVFLGFGFILLFYIMGRVVYRVEYGIFLGIFLTILYFCGTEPRAKLSEHSVKISTVTAAVLSALCLLYHIPSYIPDSEYKVIAIERRKEYVDSIYNNSWDYNARKYRKIVGNVDLSHGLITEMESNPDSFYFLEFESTIQSLYYDWNVYDSLGVGYYHNFMYLSGVTTQFPDVINLLSDKDLANPYKSLIKENVYLVDNNMHQIILIYLQEHYYPHARIEWIKNVEGYDIWKYYEE